MFRSRRASLTGLMGVAALTVTLLVPDVAAADGLLEDGWTEATPYCALLVGTPGMVCADSPATLDAAVGDGALTDDATAGGRPPVVPPGGDADVTPEAAVLIARLYDNSNYDIAAGYLDVYGNACTATKTDIDASQSTLGTYNNRTSSFQSYSGCATKLYTATSFGGTSYPSSGYLTSTTYVGATMNDNAESARFS